ncbi:metal-dependent transcriptional regulator [Stomatohabitans albus]|uniref:metal-dependent transcriptional regulator n=1 Tax=Stomatohabitans albus TaxID=3110766 RepID=UPI00300D555A
MTPLIDATEMYLRTVWELVEEGIPPLRARLVERLGVSAPAVSETVAKLEAEGLVYLDERRRVILTEKGQHLAAGVMRKHRLAERLLTDIVGVDWAFAHSEACKWEHVISDTVETKIYDVLGGPTTSPFGNPIPKGDVPTPWRDLTTVRLAARHPGRGVIARISEAVQFDIELLEQMERAGAIPGASVTIQSGPDGIEISADNGLVYMTEDQADHVWVASS